MHKKSVQCWSFYPVAQRGRGSPRAVTSIVVQKIILARPVNVFETSEIG